MLDKCAGTLPQSTVPPYRIGSYSCCAIHTIVAISFRVMVSADQMFVDWRILIHFPHFQIIVASRITLRPTMMLVYPVQRVKKMKMTMKMTRMMSC